MADRPRKSRGPGRRPRTLVFTVLILVAALALTLTQAHRFVRGYVPYLDEISSLSKELEADLPLVLAIIRTESGFRQQAVSPRGAVGLMQIMPDTAAWMAEQLKLEGFEREKLPERHWNLTIGISYINYLQRQFPGSKVQALAAYNAGQTRVRSWIETGVWDGTLESLDDIPFAETRNYVRRVLAAYETYKKLYG